MKTKGIKRSWRNSSKRVIAGVLATMTLMGSIVGATAYADSAPIVTIGADLTEEQRATVLNFLNVSEDKVMVVEINNQQERQYLEGLVPDSVIGTRTISCSYIMPTTEGGIIVKTANLTWVSDGMIANALMTAGIENCQVICTAPFEVSGTGALTGVLASYEQSSDTQLDEEKKQLATEELVVSGEVADEIVQNADAVNADGTSMTQKDVLALLNDIKSEIANQGMSKEDVSIVINNYFDGHNIELSDETLNKLEDYFSKFSSTDYGADFKEKLSGLTSKIENGFDFDFEKTTKEERSWLSKIWTAICNFFKSIFGGEKEDPDYKVITEKVDNIFEDISEDSDTGITFDDSVTGEGAINPEEDADTEVEDNTDTTVEEAPVDITEQTSPEEDKSNLDEPVQDVPEEVNDSQTSEPADTDVQEGVSDESQVSEDSNAVADEGLTN